MNDGAVSFYEGIEKWFSSTNDLFWVEIANTRSIAIVRKPMANYIQGLPIISIM